MDKALKPPGELYYENGQMSHDWMDKFERYLTIAENKEITKRWKKFESSQKFHRIQGFKEIKSS
ncbi:hypothetical protein A3Q56_08126 [Intoshia linei]|uniref:Uncharacterized protein n=1 Tax=Intoshia linei TaxID=1819745 RepID=A0A177AQL5_9BILA|nr:hypothetical protein A3Q56_08126 [Intoshia linei]